MASKDVTSPSFPDLHFLLPQTIKNLNQNNSGEKKGNWRKPGNVISLLDHKCVYPASHQSNTGLHSSVDDGNDLANFNIRP